MIEGTASSITCDINTWQTAVMVTMFCRSSDPCAENSHTHTHTYIHTTHTRANRLPEKEAKPQDNQSQNSVVCAFSANLPVPFHYTCSSGLSGNEAVYMSAYFQIPLYETAAVHTHGVMYFNISFNTGGLRTWTHTHTHMCQQIASTGSRTTRHPITKFHGLCILSKSSRTIPLHVQLWPVKKLSSSYVSPFAVHKHTGIGPFQISFYIVRSTHTRHFK